MLLHIESMTIKCYYKYNQRNISIKLKGTLEGKKTKVDSQPISIGVKGQRGNRSPTHESHNTVISPEDDKSSW